MNQVAKMIKSVLFDDKEHNFEFVTWTGEGNSFIIKHNGKEYRIEVKEEISTDIKISYDYQNHEETIPYSEEAITEAFELFKDDAGLVINVNGMEFFFENMDEYEVDILTCVDDGAWIKASSKELLKRLK